MKFALVSVVEKEEESDEPSSYECAAEQRKLRYVRKVVVVLDEMEGLTVRGEPFEGLTLWEGWLIVETVECRRWLG